MLVQNIGINQAVLNANSPAGPLAERSAGISKPTAQDARSTEAQNTKNPQVFLGIQSAHESLNKTATSVKIADTAMVEIHDYIAAIKAKLENIVKNYPPFPPGSEERVRALKSFSAFRKEIDELTIPPPDKGAAQIMADPAVVPTAGKLEVVINDKKLAVNGQQVHTGPTGLDIPPLPETATDKDISAMLEKLDAAQEALGKKRVELARDALSLIQDAQSSSEGQLPALSDTSVEVKSREVRDSMAQLQGPVLAQNQPALAELV